MSKSAILRHAQQAILAAINSPNPDTIRQAEAALGATFFEAMEKLKSTSYAMSVQNSWLGAVQALGREPASEHNREGLKFIGDELGYLAQYAAEAEGRRPPVEKQIDFEKLQKEHRLKDQHIRILRIIHEHGPITASKIREKLKAEIGHTYASDSSLNRGPLKKLSKSGLIKNLEPNYIVTEKVNECTLSKMTI